MVSTDNLCMSCMREIGSAKQCPYCGYHTDSAQISPYLPVRTVIANRYLVGKLLDYNGEGATYIGWDLLEKKAINIREFIPEGISTRTTADPNLKIMPGHEMVFRDCLQSFNELWSKLLRLRGLAALIYVTDIVDAFGTLYAIHDHVEGVTLREYLLTSKTGCVSWNRAIAILLPILSTLGTLHSSGIIHRGISPSTLLIGKDGKIRITGFSIWQARTARSDLNAQLYPGYSAVEQYGFEGQQGPWTDVYAFGAVLYRTLIGSDPIDATERVANDRLMVPGRIAETLPEFVINGLINSLQILPEDRTRTIDRLRAELSGSPEAAAPKSELYSKNIAPVINPPAEKPKAPAKKAVSKQKQNDRSVALKAAGISIAAGLLVFLLLVFTVFRDDFGIGTNEETSTSVTQSNNSQYIPVPDFYGKSYLDVQSNPVFTSLYNFEVQYTYSDTMGSGYIVNQSIAANTQVIEGTTITLYVSKGKEKVTLPAEIIGQDYDTVYERLVSLGFEVERKDVEDEEGYEDNEVISASPIEGNAYDKGTKVTLKVYKAPETTEDTSFDIGTPWDEPESTDANSEMPTYDYPYPTDHGPEESTDDTQSGEEIY